MTLHTATSVLRSEHATLRKMLEFTKSSAERVRGGESIKPEALSRVVEFFRVFMEECLLTKEEEFLVPALERRGLSRHSKPVALTLMGHALGRQLLGEMAKASAAYENGTKEAAMKWAGLASEFADLMLGHLEEEDASLLMMADSFLQPDEQAELAERFERLEAAKATTERHRRIHALPEHLLREDDELELA